MKPVLSPAGPVGSERRESHRHQLSLDAQVRLHDHLVTPVLMHELSRTGFLMQCDAPVGVGERFDIELQESGHHAARAIWACGSLIGCEFQDKLSVSRFSEVLLRARPRNSSTGWTNVAQAESALCPVESGDAAKAGRSAALIVAISVGLWATAALALLGAIA